MAASVHAAGVLPVLTIHALRHTHASWLIASGEDMAVVQARLGHESVSRTIDVYAHLQPDTRRRAATVAARAFGDRLHHRRVAERVSARRSCHSRDYLDETAPSLLVGSPISGVATTFLIIAMHFADPTHGVTGVAAAIITYLAAYIGVLFLMTIPAMYAAYAETNKVRKEIAGFRR